MQTSISDYYKKLAIAGFILIVLIAVLSFVLYNHGPRVRLVRFEEGFQSSSFTKDATITISFDRLLKDADYSDAIRFTPEAPFAARTSGQNILITLNESLLHDTDYTLTIDPVITDTTDTVMRGQYRHTFTTTIPRYVYLERNYGELIGTFVDQDDFIKIGAPGQPAEELFSHPRIRFFAANADYVVAVTQGDGRDAIHTINIRTGDVREEQFIFGDRVEVVAMSPRGSIVLLSVSPNFDSVSPDSYDELAGQVKALDAATGTITPLTDGAGESIQATSIAIDVNGQVALIQDFDLTFKAISPFNDYEPVLIGSYTELLSVDATGGNIIFRDDTTGYVRYDINAAAPAPDPLAIEGEGYITQITSQGGIFASEQSNFGESRANIFRVFDWSGDRRPVWTEPADNNQVLRSFTTSYDGSLLALHMNPEPCQFDEFGVGAECSQAFTQVYDVQMQQVVGEFPGFGLVWLP